MPQDGWKKTRNQFNLKKPNSKQSQNHKQLFETENIESEIVSRC